MERSEPTFVPEWLKSSGGLSTTSHQLQLSSLHSDEQGVSKATRNKSFDNDLGRPSVSDRTTSSYFRRTSSSNGASHLRSYSSFGRNHRDRDWDKDIHEFREKEKPDGGRHRDYSDPLGSILPSRFEKEGLRRSHSSVSAKRGESWPRKLVSDSSNANNKNGHNNGSALRSSGGGGGAIGSVKTAFERDFPSLGAEEKQIDSEIGRVPSPGLTTAIQSLPIGNSAVIGGDGWTSALAEVPVIVGSNGSNTSVPPPPVQSTSISSTATGRNMAETLAQGPPRTQTAPQLSVGTQRLEELAVKQSRQLIPMTPSMPKALALNSSDKPKPKVGQLQLQSSHLVNHTHSPRPISTKFDASKTPSVGKLHVLKPSRERNGVTPISKDNVSPTGAAAASKLPNSPLAVTSVVGSALLRNPGNNPTTVAVAVKPPGVAATTLEKRPSSQAQSRNDFFNLMRKKSMTNNSSAVITSDTIGSSIPASDKPETLSGDDPVAVDDGSGGVQVSSGNKDDLSSCNGDATNGKNSSSSDTNILYSEEEEARFLRSLGWEETGEEEEGLTEEEISSFYRDVSKYLNLQAASKIFKPKLLMPQMGNNGEISSDSKLES